MQRHHPRTQQVDHAHVSVSFDLESFLGPSSRNDRRFQKFSACKCSDHTLTRPEAPLGILASKDAHEGVQSAVHVLERYDIIDIRAT
jgi:hypothetical protein